MSEKTLDLKAGEKNTPDGGGQPENNTSESSDELEKEIDGILEKDDVSGIEYEEYDDDKVIVSKSEVEKMYKDKENYKTGLLSVKGKMKKPSPASPAKEPKDSDALTKADFYKVNERQAIASACKDPEVDTHWEEVIKYYNPKRGKSTVDDIVADIDDALTIYQKHHKSEEGGDDKKVVGKLASDKGKSLSESGDKKEAKGSLKIPEKTKIQDWYPDEK